MDKYINYYKVLGVSKYATQKEIKTSYYKLSKEVHPDMGGDAEEFKLIVDAYKVLIHKAHKEEYDLKSKHGLNYSELNELYDYEYNNDAKSYDKDKYEDFVKRDQLNILHYIDDTFNGSIEYERWIYCKDCSGSGMDDKAKTKLGGAINETYYFDSEEEVEEFIQDESIIDYKAEMISSTELLIKLNKLMDSDNLLDSEYQELKDRYQKQDEFICLEVKKKPSINFFDLAAECEFCEGTGKWGELDCFYCSGSGKVNGSKCSTCKGEKRILGKQTLSNIQFPKDAKDYKVEHMGNFSRDVPGKSGHLWIIKKSD